MNKPRQYTQEEIREMFIDHLHDLAAYWSKVEGQTVQERMEGLVFSTLTMLDGCACGLPAFEIIPAPHPSDEPYHKNEGKNWWPSIPEDLLSRDDVVTVHGNMMLHDVYSQGKWNKSNKKDNKHCTCCEDDDNA